METKTETEWKIQTARERKREHNERNREKMRKLREKGR